MHKEMDEKRPETSTGVLDPYSSPYSSPYSLPCFRESTGWSRGGGGGERDALPFPQAPLTALPDDDWIHQVRGT